jgi:hypothetical protein
MYRLHAPVDLLYLQASRTGSLGVAAAVLRFVAVISLFSAVIPL